MGPLDLGSYFLVQPFPAECYRDGDCVAERPVPGAITLRHPLMNRVHYKDKGRGKIKWT